MSQALIAKIAEMSRRIDQMESRDAPTLGALEAIVKGLADLQSRVKALEEKRGPGRPPNSSRTEG